MRLLILLCLTAILFGCQQKADTTKELQNQIDRLENQLSEAYKPGIGDFMGVMQTHHAKLWFAGKNENWELADFEIHELEDGFKDLEKYHNDRIEIEPISIIYPALDSVSNAIDRKDVVQFERSYNFLTNTCTGCHKATDYEFIQITIPSIQNFSNQRFTIE